MKKIILAFLLFFAFNAVYSVDTVQVKSKITDVTVFFNGAQITRTTDVKLKKGKHVLVLSELPQVINPASIQIAAMPKCKILSVKYQIKTPNFNKKDKSIIGLEDKIRLLEQKMKEMSNQIRVFDLEEKLLLDNSYINISDSVSSIKSIKDAAEFYRIRLNEIMQKKLNISLSLSDLNDEKQELYKQLNEIVSKSRKIYGEIFIALDCENDINDKLKAQYYISSAAWIPSYDFRVDDVSKPLVIVYNADVYQTSGESWENVNITLSTNNPSLSGDKPELTPWQVGTNPYQNNANSTQTSNIQGIVTQINKITTIPYATIMLYRGDQLIASTSSNSDGKYFLRSIPVGFYTLKASYIGYANFENKSVYIAANIDNYLNIAMNFSTNTFSKESIPATTEGVYSIDGEMGFVRGVRTDGTVTYIDGVKVIEKSKTAKDATTTDYISNSLKSVVSNLEYAIEIPYSIPADGQNYSIKIKEVSSPVNYVYHVVPKLEKEAFLSAEIIDWTVLNLLSGKINIYYQGTYTGESFIDANNASDTLSVSLGRDKGILVQRDGNKEKFDKKTIGSNIKETIAWDITVKNNKDAKIKIIVEEQYPLSYRKTIEVLLMEALNAKIDDKTGKLTWEIELNPGEKKVLNFMYSVKYPKYTNLLVE